jgi:hypothetical protein
VISSPLVASLLEVRRSSQARYWLPPFLSSFGVPMPRGFLVQMTSILGVTFLKWTCLGHVWMARGWCIHLPFYCPFTFLLIRIGMCFVPPAPCSRVHVLDRGLACEAKRYTICGAMRH